MVATIVKSKKPEYKDTLRMSKMAKFEYVILSKVEFMEPYKPESYADADNQWEKYTVKVHEINTLDEETGDKVNLKPEQEVTLFASAKTLKPLMASLPLDTKVKLFQTPVDGKSYSVYNMEYLEGEPVAVPAAEPAPAVAAPAPAAEVTADDKIKKLKASGLSVEDVFAVVGPQFNLTEEFVKMRYEAL